MVKIWKQPVERILSAGLTVLPLAPVAQVGRGEVTDVLKAVSKRLESDPDDSRARTLWDATVSLMTLRYSAGEIESFMRGVPSMLFGIRGLEETSVYQEALHKGETLGEAKGRVEEARKILILQGRKKFGPPDEQVEAKIAAVSDPAYLDELIVRLLDVASWDELLESPNP